MKNRNWKIATGQRNSRSVLECGGPPPLFMDRGQAIASPSVKGPMHLKTRRSFALLLGFILLHSSLCLRASGQTYSIDWHKIAGGGGTSTGGVYSISGTIGQHDASTPLTGGPYSLTGGFWAIISAVQTPGLPNLTITHSGNHVIVSWPNNGTYTLQQNPNVANPAGWTTSAYSINSLNGTNSITLPSPTGNLFFRLHQ